MVPMRRLIVVVALLFASGLTPISAHAASPSPSAQPVQSSQPTGHRAEKAAARAAFKAALQAVANGRDLAFADAKATRTQALQTAGKDHAAIQAAYESYKAAAMQIITAYKQAIATSTESFKAVIAALSGK